MKKLLYLGILALKSLIISAMLCLIGCSGMNDTQQEFIEMGSRIYAGKIDSLVVRGGDHRVQISGLMYYAYTAEKCVIEWGTGVDTISLDQYAKGDTLKVIIPGLEEGAHYFYVRTFDKEGNRSLQETCMGYSYGEQYILQAGSKVILEMNAEPSGMVLVWGTSEDAVSVEVKYESSMGEETLTLPGDVAETKLPDWKLSGYIKTRTQLLPEEGAIDMLWSDWVTQYFQDNVEFKLNKSKIKPLKLPRDATTGYSGKEEGVFDGIVKASGNQFHSGSGVGVPQHLTFDLGVLTDLTRVEVVARGDVGDTYHNWNPKKIQFWGIADTTGAKITLPSADAGWEDEAVAKGWTKLLDDECGDPITNVLQFDAPVPRIRYLIIRTTEVYGPPSSGSGAYVILREVTLHADYIEDLP
jgi:hypothetical protein